jgi:hypothetical protein
LARSHIAKSRARLDDAALPYKKREARSARLTSGPVIEASPTSAFIVQVRTRRQASRQATVRFRTVWSSWLTWRRVHRSQRFALPNRRRIARRIVPEHPADQPQHVAPIATPGRQLTGSARGRHAARRAISWPNKLATRSARRAVEPPRPANHQHRQSLKVPAPRRPGPAASPCPERGAGRNSPNGSHRCIPPVCFRTLTIATLLYAGVLLLQTRSSEPDEDACRGSTESRHGQIAPLI